jgi:hypothetical protein
MGKIFRCGKFHVFLAAFFSILACAGASFAELSASGAFTLIRTVPPGEEMASAVEFLGAHASERTIDAKKGIKVRRWGAQKDKWVLDVLHDGDVVRAARVTWLTKSLRERQTIFAQLTGAGKNFFGKSAVFHGKVEAEWTDFGEKWLVRARQGDDGVALLSGIRDALMDSGQYGF